MDQNQLEDLKADDEVGIGRYHYRCTGPQTMLFGKVNRINGHGHIIVGLGPTGKVVFNKRGDERGMVRGTSGYFLVDVNRAKSNNDAIIRQREINFNVNALLEALNGRKNGYGDYKMDGSARDQLRRLLEQI